MTLQDGLSVLERVRGAGAQSVLKQDCSLCACHEIPSDQVKGLCCPLSLSLPGQEHLNCVGLRDRF